MKFGLLYEIALPRQVEATGKTEYDAYWEAIQQIKLAEELGFDSVWGVEHHFLEDLARCSSPEVFLAAVAQHTTRRRCGMSRSGSFRDGTLTHEEILESLRLFAEKVMPNFVSRDAPRPVGSAG